MTSAEFLRWAAGVPTAVWAIIGFEESKAMDVVEFVPPDEFPPMEYVVLN